MILHDYIGPHDHDHNKLKFINFVLVYSMPSNMQDEGDGIVVVRTSHRFYSFHSQFGQMKATIVSEKELL